MWYRINIAIVCSIFALSLVKAQNDSNDDSQPRITEPENQPVYAQTGLSFTLICEYHDPSDVSVLWYRNGKEIDTGKTSGFVLTTKKVEDDDLGRVVISNLTKNDVSTDDEGNYECRPGNGGAGTGYMTAVVVVAVEATNDTLEVGKDAELGCRLKGAMYSKVSFKWYRAEDRDNELKDGEKYAINQDNGTLTIKNAVESDAGQYVCKYTMVDGGVMERTVSLNSVPFVRNFESKSKNLVQGDPLTVNCKVYSEPKPLISWLKDDLPLNTADPRIKLSEHDGLENATLRIEDLDFDDRAVYMCSAVNEFGVGNNTVMVRVKDKLAALWPFLGICAEVVILCTIIFIYEKRRAKKMEEEEMPEEAGHLTNSHDHKGKDDIRQRK